jgi:hypothetical protein
MRRISLLVFLSICACSSATIEDVGFTSVDATPGRDASRVDAEPAADSGVDGGSIAADAGEDAAIVDAGTNDSGEDDSGAIDSGVLDSGLIDSGANDSGAPDGGNHLLFVETSTGGRVSSDPRGLDCRGPSTCAADFPPRTMVTLTASAAPGFSFSAWTGDCSGTSSTATVSMTSDKRCSASFVGTQGAIAFVPPPVSVVPNDTEDDVNILFFVERADFVLPVDLPFDVHVPGPYRTAPGIGGVVPAGTRVKIYFVHFDPVGTALVSKTAVLTLPEEIIGLAVESPTLDATDPIAGRTDIAYPNPRAHFARALELNGEDNFTFGPDRRTITLDLRTSSSSDQIRIIAVSTSTRAPTVFAESARILPAPASVEPGMTESTTIARFFRERTTVAAADIPIDITTPGTYNSPAAVTRGTLPAGTRFTSWFMHVDPVGTTSFNRVSTITFDRPILGVAVLAATLDATDPIAGAPNTTYPTPGNSTRELDLGTTATNDNLTFAADGRSLRITARADSSVDQVRIFLAD